MIQQNSSKLQYINNLRILLIIMIIMIHVAITYGAEGSWYYSEQTDLVSGILLTMYCAVTQSFALGFFFMISGYFTPGPYERKGPGKYFKDRLVRLGIPLLIYFFVLDPLIKYTLYTKLMGQTVPVMNLFGTGPLWFVETLLIFSIGYHLGNRFFKERSLKFDAPGSPDLLRFALILSLAGFFIRIWWPAGDSFSNLQFGFFPGYIAMFAVGVLAYKNNWFENFSYPVGIKWLKTSGILILLFPVIVIVTGAAENADPFTGGLHWQSLVYSTWEALVGTGLIAGLFVIFREKFNYQGRLAKLLADNVYTVYIIHAPVVIFFSYAVRNIYLYPLLKFALAAVLEVSLCFIISHLVIRRIPYSEKVL